MARTSSRAPSCRSTAATSSPTDSATLSPGPHSARLPSPCFATRRRPALLSHKRACLYRLEAAQLRARSPGSVVVYAAGPKPEVDPLPVQLGVHRQHFAQRTTGDHQLAPGGRLTLVLGDAAFSVPGCQVTGIGQERG